MRRQLRGDMPIPVTLPLHFDLQLHTRRRRWFRVAVAALAVLGAALLAAGFWLPARAELAGVTLAGADRFGETAERCDTPLRAIRDLAIGDELTHEQADGTVRVYEVTALDVVDSARVKFPGNTDERFVALVTCWPFAATTVSRSWRYVVTARLRL